MYADVILPIPLYAPFTYVVPPELEGTVAQGSRVLVQFGRGKTYTGVVSRLHASAPADGTPVKEILIALDAAPALRNPQLRFWQWIADYYLCSPGEVMRAALPAALKVESETWLAPHPDLDPADAEGLTDTQALIYAYLVHAKRQKLSDVAKGLAEFAKADAQSDDITPGIDDAPLELTATSPSLPKKKKKEPKITAARLHADISALLERGLLCIGERIADKYVSKKVSRVSLLCDRDDQKALHAFFEKVTRSRQQEKLLLAYIDASGWMQPGASLKQVEKKLLLEKAGASPAILKAMVDKGIFRIDKVAVNRFSSPADGSDALADPTQIGRVLEARKPVLSDAQAAALRDVRRSMADKLVTLLHGVTGSGKTELYSHLIADTLAAGNQALMLVPEISLTTQLTERLRRIFGSHLLVYHSKFSDSERVDIWHRLRAGHEPMLILGVRSSVFLPFARLGLIVVDEEHEASYKQYDPAPRYNARDAAIMLATMHGAKVLLGSATPSVETYYKAGTGKYGLVELPERYGPMHLPEVIPVDMRRARKEKQVTGPYSSQLLAALSTTKEQGKQSIIFQNRRGFAPIVVCAQCGWTPRCVNCDVSMVYHKRTDDLRCHYCGHSAHLPQVCPACGGNTLKTWGYGTERLADTLHELIPKASIARMDLDTTRNKDAYEQIIGEFSRKDTQVLVGTQMVSKGLDFAGVTLVGIVNADTLLNFPDFRSDERAFCMMEQVSGRAGRRDAPGKVIVQTTTPDHHVIRSLVRHDYKGFYAQEIEQRRRFGYPPFTKVINIYLRHKDEQTLINLAVKYTMAMQRVFGHRVLGPESPYVGRVAGYHIRTLMLKVEAAASMAKVKEILRQIEIELAREPGFSTARLHYDVDPV